MTEILFYHLTESKLEDALPPLLDKSIERGWRVVVQTIDAERRDALDTHLWVYRDDSFLPHGTDAGDFVAEQPILVVADEGNGNAATVRFLVDGAEPPPVSEYERVVFMAVLGWCAAIAETWKERSMVMLAGTGVFLFLGLYEGVWIGTKIKYLLQIAVLAALLFLPRIRMPRQDIADYLGLTIETVSRVVTKLKARSVIALGDARTIDIVRLEVLRSLCS